MHYKNGPVETNSMNHLSQHSACQQKPIRSPRETHSSESQLEYLSLLFCCIWQPNSTVGNRFHRWLSWAAAICDPLVSVLVIMCKNTQNCLTGSNQWATSPSILLPTMARQMPAGSWAEKVQKALVISLVFWGILSLNMKTAVLDEELFSLKL